MTSGIFASFIINMSQVVFTYDLAALHANTSNWTTTDVQFALALTTVRFD